MAHTSGEDPQPRASAFWAPRWEAPYVGSIPLSRAGGGAMDFNDVLASRKSVRQIGGLSLERLGALLWHAGRTRSRRPVGGQEHRASPASGGIHPIELLVVLPDRQHLYQYDPLTHELREIAGVAEAQLARATQELGGVLPDARGAFIILAGDLRRVDAAYDHPESLLWRDAGCLLAILQLVSTWLGLVSCPLGVLGSAVVYAAPTGRELVPAGAFAVGEAC